MDIGCAYGNLLLATLEDGATNVIAYDMCQEHLDDFLEETKARGFHSVKTQKGIFPQDFVFKENTLVSVHASHVLEFLTGEELMLGLKKIYDCLMPGGKLFVLTYTPFINEIDNPKFREDYAKRKNDGVKWPGYLADYDYFVEEARNNQEAWDNLPVSLHLYEKDILVGALKNVGFKIESASYLDGKENGAVQETWLNAREYLGIIAYKG